MSHHGNIYTVLNDDNNFVIRCNGHCIIKNIQAASEMHVITLIACLEFSYQNSVPAAPATRYVYDY